MSMSVGSDVTLMTLELIFGTLHASLLLFLFRSRNQPIYNSMFYSVYSIISVADLCHIIGTIFYNQFADLRFFVPFYDRNPLFAVLLNMCTSYTAHFEILGHTVIAYNRYTVIKHIGQPRRKWPKMKSRAFVVVMCSVPFCMYAYRFPFEISYHFTDVGYSVTFTDQRIQRIVSIVNLTYYTINVVLSVCFTVLTYIGCQSVYKTRVGINFTEKNEIKLYIYSVFTVVCLLGRFTYEWVVLGASLTNAIVVIGYAQRCLPFLAAFYALSGTPFLLFCSARIRRDYCIFYGLNKYLGNMNISVNNVNIARSSLATVSPVTKGAPTAWKTTSSKRLDTKKF